MQGLLVSLLLSAALPALQDSQEESRRILFVGNSYVSTNSLPRTFDALAAAARPAMDFHWEMIAPGGCTFERHCKEEGTLDRIAEGNFDVVVLQEQSTRPLDDPALMMKYGGQLIEATLESGARPILFSTWARKAQPSTVRGLSRAYSDLAEVHGGLARIPAGDAFAALRGSGLGSKLYRRDGAHPSPAGTYFVACLLYGLLADYPVETFGDLWQGKISEKEAALLHQEVGRHFSVFGFPCRATLRKAEIRKGRLILEWEPLEPKPLQWWILGSPDAVLKKLRGNRKSWTLNWTREIHGENVSVIPVFEKTRMKKNEKWTLLHPGTVWLEETTTQEIQILERSQPGSWQVIAPEKGTWVGYWAPTTAQSRSATALDVATLLN